MNVTKPCLIVAQMPLALTLREVFIAIVHPVIHTMESPVQVNTFVYYVKYVSFIYFIYKILMNAPSEAALKTTAVHMQHAQTVLVHICVIALKVIMEMASIAQVQTFNTLF